MTDEQAREAAVEALTAGLLVIILALFLFANVADSLAMTAAGLVLLGSAVYQSQRGWHVAVTTWVLGGVLLLGGIGVRVFLVGILRINWVAIGLLLVGGYIVFQSIGRFRR